MLKDKKILIGITGSIAAYKTAYLVRALIKEGCEVQILMSKAATAFVSSLTFTTLSRRPVFTDIIENDSWSNHVELGLWADLMIVAPATANTMARMAQGLCSDMLTATYLSARCPVWIAPAMDLDMWQHPSTQRNVSTLQSDGVRLIDVEYGELASGLVGQGRMAEPEHIVDAVRKFFEKKKALSGWEALVTAGPTFESLDPVRFIGNRSSGKMGLAVALELAHRGANVHLVIGPHHLSIPETPLLKVYSVESASEMAEVCQDLWPACHLAVLAAAVADYTPAEKAEQKIKKKEGELNITLKRTTDIAAMLGKAKRPDQISVGFALETQNEEANAIKKIQKKNFDFIVLNSLQDEGAGFQYDTNKVTILDREGGRKTFGVKPKTEVASDIVDVVEMHIDKKGKK